VRDGRVLMGAKDWVVARRVAAVRDVAIFMVKVG
jgi:hypothetical protein